MTTGHSDRNNADPHACTGLCQGHGAHKPAARTFPVPPQPIATRRTCRIDGIILAAGQASRMGRCKAVLPLNDSDMADSVSALEAAAIALQGGCNGTILVVTGFHDTAVREEAERLGLPTVHNPDAAQGMFSSVQTGLRALLNDSPRKPDAIFMLPVDIPLVRPATCAMLAESFAETCTQSAISARPAVLYPSFSGERGHPPLIRNDIAERALAHNGTGGLRAVLEQVEQVGQAETAGKTVCDIPVADSGMLLDMDTPQAYETIRSYRAAQHVPTDREIAALLAMAQTPPHVQNHGRHVAAVAVCMGTALNAVRSAGAHIDLPLVHAAGCLHDICKGARHHEQAGGLFLARHGFMQVADCVAAHRDIDPATVVCMGERELVMLADKFVRGTTLVPIAERFNERLREWKHDAQAVLDIGGRKSRALTLCAMLETELGTDVYTLLQEQGPWKTA